MAEIWGAAIAAAGALGGAYISSQGGSGGGGAPQRNLGNELGQINNQYQSLLGQLTGGTGNFNASTGGNLSTLLGGSFDEQKFFAANPEAYRQYKEATDAGGLQGWTPAQFASAYLGGGDISKDSNGGALLKDYQSGGVGDISGQLNTQNRANNLLDAANFAKPYSDLMHNTNAGLYNQIDTFTNAANAPIQQSGSQQQAAQQASQGFGTFDPSGLYANTNFTSQTINPQSIQSQAVHAQNGNPLLAQLNAQAMANQGPSQIQSKQNTLANQLLDQGGNLSESELRNVQQSSRAGFAARGLDATNASVVDESFQTDAARRARLTQNLGLAQGIQNQGLAEQNQQQQFGLGVGSQDLGYSQLNLQGQTTNANNALAASQSNQSANLSAQTSNQGANLQAQNMGLQAQTANQNFGLGSFNANVNSQVQQQQALQAAAGLAEQQRQSQISAQLAAVNAQKAGALDPYAAMLSGDQNNLGVLAGLYGTNAQTNSSLLSALLGYGGDLNNTNYNANVAAGIANGNNNAALGGALIGAGAKFGGAVYGSGSSTGGGLKSPVDETAGYSP